MNEEGVVLVVMYDVRDGRERQVANHVLTLSCGVYVEMLATGDIDGEREILTYGCIHIATPLK